MAIQIKNKSKVEIGVVPTHLMFVGALAPDESGKLPRTNSGDLKIVSGMRLLCRTSPVKLNNVQVTLFPGTDAKDLDDMFKGLRALKLQVHLIMMVGGANPLNPKDEDAVVEMLNSGLAVAKKYKVKLEHCLVLPAKYGRVGACLIQFLNHPSWCVGACRIHPVRVHLQTLGGWGRHRFQF